MTTERTQLHARARAYRATASALWRSIARLRTARDTGEDDPEDLEAARVWAEQAENAERQAESIEAWLIRCD